MAKPKKRNPLRKIFKKNQNELPTPKALQDMGDTPTASKSDHHQLSGTPDRKSKKTKGFWSGLKGVIGKEQGNSNTTFMTAETEKTSADDVPQKFPELKLDLFPDLQGNSCPEFQRSNPGLAPMSLSGSSSRANSSSGEGDSKGKLHIWKEFVSEGDGNLEVRLSSGFNPGTGVDFVADFEGAASQLKTAPPPLFPGVNAVPFDDYGPPLQPSYSPHRQHQQHRRQPPVPDTVNFQTTTSGAMSIVSDFGLESAYTPTYPPSVEPFPAFENDVSGEISGFLSPEQEQTLGMAPSYGQSIPPSSASVASKQSNNQMPLVDDGRFADADNVSLGQSTMEPSIEAQIDTPSSLEIFHVPDASNAEFEVISPSEESNETAEAATKVSITSHPIVPSSSNTALEKVKENVTGMTLAYKNKKMLSKLVDHEEAKRAHESDLKSEKGAELSSAADHSSAYTRSVDGRSYRSHSSGEQTLKTVNGHRQIANVDNIENSREPPGTYAPAASDQEFRRSASDPFGNFADTNPAGFSNVKSGQQALSRVSTIPPGRFESRLFRFQNKEDEDESSLEDNIEIGQPTLTADVSLEQQDNEDIGEDVLFSELVGAKAGANGKDADDMFDNSTKESSSACSDDTDCGTDFTGRNESKISIDESHPKAPEKAPSVTESAVTQHVGNGIAKGKDLCMMLVSFFFRVCHPLSPNILNSFPP
mgnify:CR=1 FL=1